MQNNAKILQHYFKHSALFRNNAMGHAWHARCSSTANAPQEKGSSVRSSHDIRSIVKQRVRQSWNADEYLASKAKKF